MDFFVCQPDFTSSHLFIRWHTLLLFLSSTGMNAADAQRDRAGICRRGLPGWHDCWVRRAEMVALWAICAVKRSTVAVLEAQAVTAHGDDVFVVGVALGDAVAQPAHQCVDSLLAHAVGVLAFPHALHNFLP